jgi:hypothetical protein
MKHSKMWLQGWKARMDAAKRTPPACRTQAAAHEWYHGYDAAETKIICDRIRRDIAKQGRTAIVGTTHTGALSLPVITTLEGEKVS